MNRIEYLLNDDLVYFKSIEDKLPIYNKIIKHNILKKGNKKILSYFIDKYYKNFDIDDIINYIENSNFNKEDFRKVLFNRKEIKDLRFIKNILNKNNRHILDKLDVLLEKVDINSSKNFLQFIYFDIIKPLFIDKKNSSEKIDLIKFRKIIEKFYSNQKEIDKLLDNIIDNCINKKNCIYYRNFIEYLNKYNYSNLDSLNYKKLSRNIIIDKDEKLVDIDILLKKIEDKIDLNSFKIVYITNKINNGIDISSNISEIEVEFFRKNINYIIDLLDYPLFLFIDNESNNEIKKIVIDYLKSNENIILNNIRDYQYQQIIDIDNFVDIFIKNISICNNLDKYYEIYGSKLIDILEKYQNEILLDDSKNFNLNYFIFNIVHYNILHSKNFDDTNKLLNLLVRKSKKLQIDTFKYELVIDYMLQNSIPILFFDKSIIENLDVNKAFSLLYKSNIDTYNFIINNKNFSDKVKYTLLKEYKEYYSYNKSSLLNIIKIINSDYDKLSDSYKDFYNYFKKFLQQYNIKPIYNIDEICLN